jgi:hypothetical protein
MITMKMSWLTRSTVHPMLLDASRQNTAGKCYLYQRVSHILTLPSVACLQRRMAIITACQTLSNSALGLSSGARSCHSSIPARNVDMYSRSETSLWSAVRINNILVHTWDNVRRVFVKGTLIKAGSLSASVDPVLGLGYHRLRLPAATSSSTVLIGLPSILPRQLYMIPITAIGENLTLTDGANAQEFLWVERSLHWL